MHSLDTYFMDEVESGGGGGLPVLKYVYDAKAEGSYGNALLRAVTKAMQAKV